MKIHLYSFQANYGSLFDAFDFLNNKGEDALFFVSIHTPKNNRKISSYSKLLWFTHRSLTWILKKIKIPYYIIRHLQERFYDIYYSLKLKEGVIIITTSGWIPLIINKNKKLGGYSIIFGGNPCDLEISRVISKERIGKLDKKDIYSFKPRLNNYKKCIEMCDKIIVANSLIQKSFYPYIGKEKTHEIFGKIPNVSEYFPEIRNKKIERLTFCYIGHTILLKGLHLLLDAWEKVETEDIELIIGGTIQNELMPYFDQRIKSLRNVKYLGKVENLNTFFRSSNVYICPSLIDAGPRTIIEAMYCKLPIISSENCGNSYLINPYKTGLIYKENNTNNLAECINWFSNNQSKIAQMGIDANIRINNEFKNESFFYSSIYELINTLK